MVGTAFVDSVEQQIRVNQHQSSVRRRAFEELERLGDVAHIDAQPEWLRSLDEALSLDSSLETLSNQLVDGLADSQIGRFS